MSFTKILKKQRKKEEASGGFVPSTLEDLKRYRKAGKKSDDRRSEEGEKRKKRAGVKLVRGAGASEHYKDLLAKHETFPILKQNFIDAFTEACKETKQEVPQYHEYMERKEADARFTYEVQCVMARLSWTDLSKMVNAAVGCPVITREFTEVFNYAVHIMLHMVLGVGEKKGAYRLQTLDALDDWPVPNRKRPKKEDRVMPAKSKKRADKDDEELDEIEEEEEEGEEEEEETPRKKGKAKASKKSKDDDEDEEEEDSDDEDEEEEDEKPAKKGKGKKDEEEDEEEESDEEEDEEEEDEKPAKKKAKGKKSKDDDEDEDEEEESDEDEEEDDEEDEKPAKKGKKSKSSKKAKESEEDDEEEAEEEESEEDDDEDDKPKKSRKEKEVKGKKGKVNGKKKVEAKEPTVYKIKKPFKGGGVRAQAMEVIPKSGATMEQIASAAKKKHKIPENKIKGYISWLARNNFLSKN